MRIYRYITRVVVVPHDIMGHGRAVLTNYDTIDGYDDRRMAGRACQLATQCLIQSSI